MNSENKWLGAGIATAFIAALCCITPVFAVLAGIGGIAATISYDKTKTNRKTLVQAINSTGFRVAN